ncbi:6-carboxytetrahydropterin synthase [Ferrovum myxofaciens]|uniref:6-carboxy-5,6,7,8-tetrahydropterin synthase n=1 Tax=Ferrovum myxofaciens TaxID=416213 RepID=A0A9E6SYN7_9PROT|nr:6-carboxytetrahydropterin synthase [Ferrovum myxofaciens]QKE37695.1 MAG: 6-carboxytetrahydropterin synthase [Ferrovum myxofaciens]QWY75356.1 MAG: 6-carboxytetrahydropterin synthase [Ferrovum myxofaciens]QWY78096.1 MAG: 6-carboxytetrahydropterin synthase [Ferrovum myxofaciens]
MTDQFLYTASVNFEAARRVLLLPEGHRSRNLHGHSFLAEVRCALPDDWASFPGGEVEELKDKLASIISPLDYSELNCELEQPTDENLARWIRSRLDLPSVESVGVQSTLHEGVDLDLKEHAHIWRRYTFESAHQLPNVPVGHKCGRMHGHGFEVILHADQDLGGHSIGVDYDHLDALWAPVHAELDHVCLNDIPGLKNPTSEVISNWIWQRLKPQLPELSWVTVYETASCGAHFDGKNYRIWKEMTLDSAVQLRHAPEGDRRRRIHGHTYKLRLHLHANLDQVMGWTVDFGDVKRLFDPIFKRLDHHPLYEIAELADTDIASLIRWIRDQAAPLLPQLDRIDLFETRGCGAILSWGDIGPALPI